MLKYVAVLVSGSLVLAALHLPGNGCPGARLLALAGLEVGCAPASAEEVLHTLPPSQMPR